MDAGPAAGRDDWVETTARRRQRWAVGLLVVGVGVMALTVQSGPPFLLPALVLGSFGAGALLFWYAIRRDSTPFPDGVITHAQVVGHERHLSPPSPSSRQLQPHVKWASVLRYRQLDGTTTEAADAPIRDRRPVDSSVRISYRSAAPRELHNLDHQAVQPLLAYLVGGIALSTFAVGLLLAELWMAA